MSRADLLKGVKRIVVKIGSSNITEDDVLSADRVSRLAGDIMALRKAGYQVVAVTSGAISAGAGALKRSREKLSIPEKQAFAAVGQSILMNEYRRCFLREGSEIAQILLTEDDVKHRGRFLNARHTFHTLLDLGVIPIVNENDTVAIKEIKFGDNDTLSAHVANIVEADLLILLSDVDGFFWDLNDPAPVGEMNSVTEEVRNRAGGSGSVHGTGGMQTKLKAAEIIMRSGEMMIIANGRTEGVLARIMRGEKLGTLFMGKNKSLSSRKRWIAFNMKTNGKIRIDDGALRALREKKKSLLASGITGVEGRFAMGDAIEILDGHGKPVGKGIVNYSGGELQVIMGKKTAQIREILGGAYFDEVINRDDLIVY